MGKDRRSVINTDLTKLPLSELRVDEGVRPSAPKIASARDRERAAGRQLAAIHAGYLRDLAQIARVMERIEAGDVPPKSLADIVLHTDMSRNLAAFGTICGQACHVLTMHHDIEEGHMFPGIDARASDAMRDVVDRLKVEHTIIHELLRRLRSAAVRLAEGPDLEQFETVRVLYRSLFEAVRSHFKYEETELEEAIGVYLGGV
ncbi:MAG: hemerythrin domain-containing protein [Pseudomonadota bacterium]